MARPIDADALMDYCNNQKDKTIDANDIARFPTAVGWISVKDALPKTDDDVLTTYLYDDRPSKRYVEAAGYFDDGEGKGHWHSTGDEFTIGPVRKTTIAWMPMPKPYKPPKEDNNEAN